MKNLLNLTVFAALLALSACNKKTDTPAEEPAATTTGSTTSSTPTPTTAGYYLRWESFSNGSKYNANAFANGKVYNSPYTYSEDYGETWKTAADDGLARTLVNFNGLAAEKKTNSAGTVFTILSTGASLSFSNSLSLAAWNGSSNAFVWSNGVLYKTTNTGNSWTAISSPPTHNDFIAIVDLEMSGSTVFVVQQFLEKPGNYTRYILQTSSDGGATWLESEVYSVKIDITVFASNDVIAKLGSTSTTPQGSFKVSTGSSITFTAFEFENGINSDATKIMRAAENSYIFGFTYSGINVKHPVTGKYFNASDKPSTFSGGVITDKYLIVTSGNTLYRTPFPLVFHDTP